MLPDVNSLKEISLLKLAELFVKETQDLVMKSQTEEELKIGFEKLLEPLRNLLDIKFNPQYEKSIYTGRLDALHGQMIIEYERPSSFRSKQNLNHAFEQLVNYLYTQINQTKLTNFLGVGFDGEDIFFVRYQGNKEEIDRSEFVLQGPFSFDVNSAVTFLIHLRALSRLPLNADNLALKFSPQGKLAPKFVSALYTALEHWGSKAHIQTFFHEWLRLFGIVYGEEFQNNDKAKETQVLAKLYKITVQTKKGDQVFQKLLFCIHTFFAFLMKLITAELLTLRESSFHSSLVFELSNVSEKELKDRLEDIESGGVYRRRGITNFLEGDFFRWYLDAFDSPELREAIREMARTLSEFEVATNSLEPTFTRDLLKKLYQYLVPQEIRHKLGEYYTPDWLAELLLEEIEYDGNTNIRLLDPACGSGTFLVLAIQKAIEHGKKEKWPSLEIAKRIVANIWGFDLNPLAVIASRTNYLFTLGELASFLPRLELPIYLTDSVLTPTRTSRDLFGEYLEVSTSVGEFRIPAAWVNSSFLIAIATPLIEEMAKSHYTVEEAMNRFKKEGLVFPNSEQVIKDFYSKILELEKTSRNGIWARFLKNAFAPVMAGQFDYVVGNPPWVRWGYLSTEYREATLNLWKEYGLFSLKGHAARLGGGEKDFSMLFLYASCDYYLREGGKLGFLITQEAFKSKGAGEGFRRFQIGERKHLKVLKAHDFVSIQAFDQATNKAAMILLKKGEKTKYPIPYYIWSKKKGTGKIPTNEPLKSVLPFLKKEKFFAKPIQSPTSSWQTISRKQDSNLNIQGKNYYRARQGADPQPYGVFLLNVEAKLMEGYLLVRNLSHSGKFQVPQVEAKIEQDLVYPAVRGADVQRWKVNPKIFILLTQEPIKREPYPEKQMKTDWPWTFSYLLKFKDALLSRSSKSIRDLMERTSFYAMFGVGAYTLSKYKVIWKFMSNDIFATVVSQQKTLFGYKTLVPTKTVAFFPLENEKEAHYLCAIINSKPVRDFIKSFSSAGRGFGTPSVMEHVGIPKFDPKNSLHLKLAEISMECHKLKLENKEKEIEKLEKENDDLVVKLFSSS